MLQPLFITIFVVESSIYLYRISKYYFQNDDAFIKYYFLFQDEVSGQLLRVNSDIEGGCEVKDVPSPDTVTVEMSLHSQEPFTNGVKKI